MKWIKLMSVVVAAMLLAACESQPPVQERIMGTWSIDESTYDPKIAGICLNAEGTIEYSENGTGSFATSYTSMASLSSGTSQIPVSGTITWEVLDNTIHVKIVDYNIGPWQAIDEGRSFPDIRNSMSEYFSKNPSAAYEIIRLTQDELIIKEINKSTVSRLARVQ